MDKSIVQLVDELPADNITVKVLKAIDYLMPGQWTNLVGFENSIRTITGETDTQIIQKIRDRAVVLYHDPKSGYQSAVQLYQTIDTADVAMATAALANKVGEKISFLSILSSITPKPEVTQSFDLVLKIAVEIIAFCKLNGIPQPNPQEFVKALNNNYQDAALMRMVALVCLDGMLPLGPNFLSKIHQTIAQSDTTILTQNPVFSALSNFIPGGTPSDKLGFITQGFDAVQGWINNLVAKTGITPQSIFNALGNSIQIADDNLDFVAAFIDQSTNYYQHTGIQTVARKVILQAQESVKSELPAATLPINSNPVSGSVSSGSTQYKVGQTVEVWDEEDEDWYESTIQKVKENEYYIHYVGYGSSDDEWVNEDEVRVRDHRTTDDNGYGLGQKVKVWDDEEEEWYSAIIEKIEGDQYYVHYIGYDSSYSEWVDSDEIS
ncbi:TUDOR [Planktothrix tepida]|uniref:TUDOR n=2 Tax=Planktothrix TaxID=54304 RepID=A0A1J1LIF2_9CYAN|nr:MULTISPECIES: hypothetical protein [Planktothrix]CAD5934434.1 TUDOR [Planktothrix tepida]CAD5976845.1 TUDOR [Planktothrix pseudagardhii]CUR31794.1 TUDOR [Planktothrix tepida PCC 9214]